MGIQFHPKDMECHHIVMKKRNGQDGGNDFRNLVWLYKDVHMLVHAMDADVINKLLGSLNLTDDQILKINGYREKLGNDAIVRC